MSHQKEPHIVPEIYGALSSGVNSFKSPEHQQLFLGGGWGLVKGVLHLWALFLKTLWIFSKNKAALDKVSHGSGQKYSKELQNHSFTSVGTIVVKLQWKMCENQYFPCFEP